jgi:hypothetical protein
MTVQITSRYRPMPVYLAPGRDGVMRPTVPILRHEPLVETVPAYRHRVTGAEDIELLAWRSFGSGDTWWQIADANPVTFPLDYRGGDSLSIPREGSRGRLQSRERRF